MAIEEANYKVVHKEKRIEVRDYGPQVLAETVVRESLEDAGNKAFGLLFRYISGENRSKTKIAMTSPVVQEATGEKIKMTAPVSQRADGESFAVSFMMPASYTMDTIPTPEDDQVKIRQITAHRAVAIRYSGRWTEKRYDAHLAKLRQWMKKEALEPKGPPVWARYNPPFTPWFLRRNEILIRIDRPADE